MIILASRSPQRRALLAGIGVEFRALPAGIDEGPEPLENARGKAEHVAGRVGIPAGGAVLGADTEVILDGVALGKPADATAARAMLERLAGRVHEVRTGVVIIAEGARREAVSTTRVHMRPADPEVLDWYTATGEWSDRAGGYAIQGAGAALVERIEGDYTNVVGLPVAAVLTALDALGLAPWAARRASSPAQ